MYKDKSEELQKMKDKMGFQECTTEEQVKQKQKESEELKANFEQTI